MKTVKVIYYMCEKCGRTYSTKEEALKCESRGFAPGLDKVPMIFRADRCIGDNSNTTYCAMKIGKYYLKHYMRCSGLRCWISMEKLRINTFRNQRYDGYRTPSEYNYAHRCNCHSDYITEDEFYMIDFLLEETCEPDVYTPSFKFMLDHLIKEGYNYENIYIWNGKKEEILSEYLKRKDLSII